MWTHIVDGATNAAGVVLLFFDTLVTAGVVVTSIGVASFIRNRFAAWAWKDRKRQLKEFDAWIGQLADNSKPVSMSNPQSPASRSYFTSGLPEDAVIEAPKPKFPK